MEFTNHIEGIINNRLKRSQVLLGLSIIIGLFIGYLGLNGNGFYLGGAFYFILIGALALPNINKCKKDLVDFRNQSFSYTEGVVLDMFPEKDETGKWIIFLNVEGKKEIVEYSLPNKPTVEINSVIKISHTSSLEIPVKIEVISKNV